MRDRSRDGGAFFRIRWNVEGVVATPAELRSSSPPEYPYSARAMGVEGVVTLIVEVLPEGRAGRVEVKESSGSVELDESAAQAAFGWEYAPAEENGEPLLSWIEIPVRFVLTE